MASRRSSTVDTAAFDLPAVDVAAGTAAGTRSAAATRASLVHRYAADAKFWLLFDEGDEPREAALCQATAPGPAPATTCLDLAGVPLLVSPALDVALRPSRVGVRELEGCRLPLGAEGAWAVTALVAAGATPFGAPAVPPLAWDAVGAWAKPPHNPHSSLGATTGGAHGAAAAAVSARLAPLAVVTDTLGDARVPASLTGVVAYRASPARFPAALHRALVLAPTLAAPAVLARCVEDCAAALRAWDAAAAANAADKAANSTAPSPAAATALAFGATTTGGAAQSDGADTTVHTLTPHAQSADAAAQAPPQSSLRGLRIGVLRRGGAPGAASAGAFSELHPSAAAVIDVALARMAAAGAVLVDVSTDVDGGAGAPQVTLFDLADAVIDPVLSYEAPREVARYLATHVMSPRPPAPPSADAAEDGVDGDAPADAEATPPAAAPPLVAADTVTPLSALVSTLAAAGAPVGALLASALAEATATPHAAYTAALTAARPRLSAAVDAMFATHALDLVVLPATLMAAPVLSPPPAPAVGAARLVEHPSGSGRLVDAGPVLTRNARLAAAGALPAVVVPVGSTAAVGGDGGGERLPVGLELLGRAGDDRRLLAAAAAVEALQPPPADPVAVRRWADGVYVGGGGGGTVTAAVAQ